MLSMGSYEECVRNGKWLSLFHYNGLTGMKYL